MNSCINSFIQSVIHTVMHFLIHLDLEIGQRVEEGRVGHGDLVGYVLESVDWAAIHGSRRRQVRRSRQEIRWRYPGEEKGFQFIHSQQELVITPVSLQTITTMTCKIILGTLGTIKS